MRDLKTVIEKSNIKTAGLADGIRQVLLRAILDGLLQQGERLVEADLQEQFPVSASPIREALRDLAGMGLIEIKPRKGACVKAVTLKDVEENYKVRSVLEGLAAREAYSLVDENMIANMKDILFEMQKAVSNSKPEAYWEKHYDFHDSYLKATCNKTLIRILTDLRIQNLWFKKPYLPSDLQRDLAIHIEIVDHFINRDINEEGIEALIRSHVELGLMYLKKYVQKNMK